MATINIESDIENITGVADANDQFVISAQKFVASGIPKNLLWFASTASTAADGNGIDIESSDGVLSVDRNGYPSSKVPFSMSKWIDDSSSLYKATALHPKHYDKGGKIFIKPDPDVSNTGTVQYVYYAQIDDNCDLRNAVIFYASASEFAKLASAELPSISVTAVSPDIPTLETVSFSVSNVLNISADTPTSISLSEVTYTGIVDVDTAAVSDVSTTTIDITGATQPEYNGNAVIGMEDATLTHDLASISAITDLSITAVAPDVPTLSSVTFNSIDSALDAASPVFSTATVSAASIYTDSAPSYSKLGSTVVGGVTAFDTFLNNSNLGENDPGALSITAVTPDIPSIDTVNYTPATETNIGNVSDAIVTSIVFPTSDVPEYSKPEITTRTSFEDFFSIVEDGNPFGDSDPLELSITAAAPVAPDIPNFTLTTTESLPSYTAPKVGGATEELTATLTALDNNVIGTDTDFLDFSTWFTAVGEMLEDGGDTELAQVQIEKISAYIQAYAQQVQNNLNEFDAGIQKYQAEIEKKLQEAQFTIQSEHTAGLQQYQAEIQEYQALVSSEVQEYTQKLQRYQAEINIAYQAWAKTESDTIQEYQLDIQNELNEFNKENANFQAKVQESVQNAQSTNQITLQNLQKDLARAQADAQSDSARRLQDSIQTTQATMANNSNLLQKFQNEIGGYQAEVATEVQEYTQKLARYQAELSIVLQSWQQTEQTRIAAIQADIQDELNLTNQETTAWQARVQESMQNLQAENQVNIADAQAQLQVAIGNEDRDLQRQLQNAVNDMQAIVNDNQRKIALFQAEVTEYQAEVGTEVQEWQNKTQKQQVYSKESDRYYNMAQMEIKNYIQNNSKIINKTIATQIAAQQGAR